VNVVREFFTKGWIFPSFNSNTIVLSPKIQNATSVDQYKSIAMANFKFKIISCWNKMCLTLPLESFDDDKVLKIVN